MLSRLRNILDHPELVKLVKKFLIGKLEYTTLRRDNRLYVAILHHRFSVYERVLVICASKTFRPQISGSGAVYYVIKIVL